MSVAMRAWLSAAVRRRKLAPLPESPDERRRRLIEDLAPGKSFVDVGGMWRLHGDAAFFAEAAGATRVVVFDGMDPTPEFEQKVAERKSSVEFVQGDLHDPQSIQELGAFDVVWCTGVLYHTPNPYGLIEHLRRMTRERLLLGSHVIPEIPGFPQACLWYPGHGERERKAIGRFPGVHSPGMTGGAKPFDDSPGAGYANNWWGISPSTMRSMLAIARFEVLEEFQHDPFSIDVLARPVEREPVIPPLEFARERGLERNR